MRDADLKEEYVRELRAIVWNRERIEALEFLNDTQKREMSRLAARTAAYRIIMGRLFVRLMRILG